MAGKKFISLVAALLATVVMPLSIITPNAVVNADIATVANAIIQNGAHRCNVTEPRSGKVFVQLEGSFDATSKEAILNQINGYRLEACQNGYPDPRNRGRRLTMADYVPIRWSRGLEEMSMLRAAEATYTRFHINLSGDTCWNSAYDVTSYAEVLAWSGSIPGGISQWYAERSSWVNGGRGETGHYTAMINPDNTYCGISGFAGTQAGEFTTGSGYDESKMNVSLYNSQLAEITASQIANISITCSGTACYTGLNSKVYVSCTMNAAGYAGRRAFPGIKVLPTSWTCSNPSVMTIDQAGNIHGVVPGNGNVSCVVNGVTYAASIRVVDAALIRDFASRLYSVALNRTPDPAGLAYWTERLANRQITGTQAAYGFFFSNEFLNANLSNDEYITRLYRTFLGREPEAQGFAYWQGRLASGSSRLDVFYGFSNSIEFAGICAYAGINP
ncbi:MAG: DUF4214 domain-containing protein [Saccharofermentans sp.]|nr:DUF4214 domain-containing protein [Saccharofermentans sp.]